MSQTSIKGFPKLKSNPSKLKTFLSIALVCSPFYTNAIEYCTAPSQAGEWDIVDNGNTNISAIFPVGDTATTMDAVNQVSFKILHEYAGDLQANLTTPGGSNIQLFTLGNPSNCSGAD